MPDLSIIINTYNRPGLLVQALRAILAQRGANTWSREILVVDDGSRHSPQDILRREGLLDAVRLEVADHQGPSEARNRGIQLAQGQYILFLGDDILAGPDLVAAHMRLLTQTPEKKLISLGHSEWRSGKISRPLYIYSQAHHYEGLAPGQPLDFRYFYTANIAMARLALDQAGGFDVSFTGSSWGWEDTELGYRLERAGWRIIYNAQAWAEHVHPAMTIRQMLRRQVQLGMGGCRFYAKYPTPENEAIAFWPGTRAMKSGPRWRRELGIAAATALERLAPNSNLLGKIYGRLVISCRAQGVEEGRKAFPQAQI